MFRRSLFAAELAVAFLVAPGVGSAAMFDELIVFGDSLSDSGNTYNATLAATGGTVLFPPPPYNQRATNGRTAVEYLAQDYLGYQLNPSTSTLPGNTNYAYAGAATGYYEVGGVMTSNYNDPSRGLTWLRHTGIPGQINTFLDPTNPNATFNAGTTLFVLWAGANDFFLSPDASTIGTALANLSGALQALVVEGGARNVLVPNMPNLGITPDAQSAGAAAAAELTFASQVFNANLASTLGALEQNLRAFYPELDIIPFDTFAALSQVLADPDAFGLTNVTQACYQGPTSVCTDPDSYLFWDGVHPTDAVHRILAREFAQAVPEPQTYAVLAVGLLILAAWGRRGPRTQGRRSV